MSFVERTDLYVATDGERVKIGATKNVIKRRITLGDDKGNISILRSWHLPGDAFDIETCIKKQFKDKLSYSYSWEWFDLDEDELIDAVEKLVDGIRRLNR